MKGKKLIFLAILFLGGLFFFTPQTKAALTTRYQNSQQPSCSSPKLYNFCGCTDCNFGSWWNKTVRDAENIKGGVHKTSKPVFHDIGCSDCDEGFGDFDDIFSSDWWDDDDDLSADDWSDYRFWNNSDDDFFDDDDDFFDDDFSDDFDDDFYDDDFDSDFY